MKIVTPEQMRKIDDACINDIGIPGIVLMENAAVRVTDEILKELGSREAGSVKGIRICILAGKGNNGGDGLAVGRHLYNKGADVRIFLAAPASQIKGDSKTNLDILGEMGIEVKEIKGVRDINGLKHHIAHSGLIVDGIFGTGLKGAVEGMGADIIEAVNSSGKKVLSIDIPSGVNGTTGKVQGPAIKADITVTLGLPKTGLVVHPGCSYAGRVVTVDIGIPEAVSDSMDINLFSVEENNAAAMIPKRVQDSSKGSYGKVFYIGGSDGMAGAGCLCGKAALRAGAGLVYLGVPRSIAHCYSQYVTEAVIVPLKDEGKGFLGMEAFEKAEEWLNKTTVAAIGPGMSLNKDTKELVRNIIKASGIPLVLDADALNAIACEPDMLKELKAKAVITPHPGEMARLAGISTQDVQKDRIGTARAFAQKWNLITVLKGARTIIAMPDGRAYVNMTGNSGMSTAGTGDVLTGIITAFIAQGANLEAAAAAGVYIHGKAGDEAAKEKGQHGMIAGDIIEKLPVVIKDILGQLE